jgi:hypothetical protein
MLNPTSTPEAARLFDDATFTRARDVAASEHENTLGSGAENSAHPVEQAQEIVPGQMDVYDCLAVIEGEG